MKKNQKCVFSNKVNSFVLHLDVNRISDCCSRSFSFPSSFQVYRRYCSYERSYDQLIFDVRDTYLYWRGTPGFCISPFQFAVINQKLHSVRYIFNPISVHYVNKNDLLPFLSKYDRLGNSSYILMDNKGLNIIYGFIQEDDDLLVSMGLAQMLLRLTYGGFSEYDIGLTGMANYFYSNLRHMGIVDRLYKITLVDLFGIFPKSVILSHVKDYVGDGSVYNLIESFLYTPIYDDNGIERSDLCKSIPIVGELSRVLINMVLIKIIDDYFLKSFPGIVYYRFENEIFFTPKSGVRFDEEEVFDVLEELGMKGEFVSIGPDDLPLCAFEDVVLLDSIGKVIVCDQKTYYSKHFDLSPQKSIDVKTLFGRRNRTFGSGRRSYSSDSRSYSSEGELLLKSFWESFYNQIEDKDYAGINKYQDKVLDLLIKEKSKGMSNINFYSLQMQIEDLTMNFSTENMFKSTPNLIKQLIGKDLIKAKDYLNQFLKEDSYKETIRQFGHYTLEAIIIYVLGMLYNCTESTSMVRVSTLIDTLNSTVLTQAKILDTQRVGGSPVPSRKYVNIKKEKEIGVKLVEFMIDRNVILIDTLDTNKIVVKKKGKAYYPSNAYAICHFDLTNLPIKLNLPMIYPPTNWEVKSHISSPKMLSDMTGGYLSEPTFSFYNRFRLITSHNLSQFNIQLHDPEYKEMCNILNGLQKQGFRINQRVLKFIKENRACLESIGLLMPGKLAHVNLKEAHDQMRILYFNNKAVMEECSISELLEELSKRVQVARYENFIINLATAYEDYVFYLPAFMDFRGRIYRSGVMHFHERDIARSLIVFANNDQEESNQLEMDLYQKIVACSAAFKYQKFHSFDDALHWYNHSVMFTSSESLIRFSQGASDPFQFIAKVLCHDTVQEYVPITQDATASAYQIMSYLLLEEEMAMRTNLIANPDGKISDVYECLLNEFREFLVHQNDDKGMMLIIESKLDRKLIKTLLMPLIYGKTVISMAEDIRQKYGQLLSPKKCYNLAQHCYNFWIKKYPNIVNLMKLISLISWFCSAMDRAVVYSIPYFTTIQDYMSFITEKILVYDRLSKKRRRITLSVPTTKRDKRKTQTSACANFIHQKDAFIAMKVVETLLRKGAPIYTVHDNFITTVPYVRMIPDIYTSVFVQMGHPLLIINEYINSNLIKPFYPLYMSFDMYKNKSEEHFSVDKMKNYQLHSPYHWYKEPIPSDHLTDILNSLLPEGSKNQFQQLWDQKISDLVMSYNLYVDVVYSRKNQSNQNWHNDDEKWVKFKTLLENRDHNYSVHY